MPNKTNSFLQLLRINFVVFSLYLTGDVFYRWDGFSYYASFSEFLPAAALAFILWSLVAVLTAIAVWLLLRLLIQVCRAFGWKIEYEHLLSYLVVFLVLGAVVWKGKKIIWPYEHTTLTLKLMVGTALALLSAALIWLLRSRTGKAVDFIHERITPLVWLFGFFVICSVPLVAYHTFWKTDKIELSKDTKTSASGNDSHNIILVTFDALAARNMSLYGYDRETTPFISQWSESATVFLKAEAACNFTTPAAASLMTGKRVWTHQTYHIAGMKPLNSSIESLPRVLKDNGYFNIALVVNPYASVRVLGMSDSFNIAPLTSEFGISTSLFGWKFGLVDVALYRLFGDKIRLHNWILKNEFIFSKFLNLISRNVTETEVPPEKAFNHLLEILDHDIPKPFFAWIHIFPPHDPYLSPEPFKGLYNRATDLRTYKGQEKLIEDSYTYLFQYQSFPEEMQPAVDLMRDYYDEYINYMDNKFEDFIDKLGKLSTQNTVIVLTADHGESFDHGYFTHGGPFLYEQVTHIPLIIKEPGQTAGLAVAPVVEQIDIPATILGLANIPVPSWMEGRSLVPLMRGESLPPQPAFSMNFEQNRSRNSQITNGSIAVWEGDYKLIHYLARNESLLFNLKQDPEELHNLIDREHEGGEYLLGLIQDNLNIANDRILKKLNSRVD